MGDLTSLRKDRGVKARRTGALGIVYQGVYAVSQLVGLGMLVRYVGKEQYGLWMTVLAVAAWIPMANLGQTSALLTNLGAVALTDRSAANKMFSASTLLVVGSSTLLILTLVLANPFIPWGTLLNAEGVATDSSVGDVTVAALIVSLAALPAGMGAFAVFAHQRGDLVHMIMSADALFSLGAAGVAIWLHQPLWLVGAITLSGPLLGGITLWILGLANGLVPRTRWALVDWNTLKSVLKAGFMFLLVDTTTLVFLRTPDVIVAHIHGVDAVGPFASVGRLPLLMMAIFLALLLPYWPALCEATHRGDHGWVRRIALRTLVMIIGLWGLGAMGIWLLGAFFVHLWTGSSEFSSPSLIAAACVQSLGLGLLAWLSVFLSALSLQRQLVLAAGVASLVFLPLAFYLGNQFGPVGVALAQAGALLFCAFPLGGMALYRKLAQG
ncbi:lipopolysaccharide biosynthesis protein [Propionivibrio sp.]|uniref:lipopolysaccharide biosynthesis protein n=1 Tax=Propionivibrio sp. TaxID=2212460 RepID=UPI003BF360A7